MSRRELDTDDPTAIRPYLTTVYDAGLSVRLLGDDANPRPWLSHVRLEADGFAVEHIRHGGDVEARSDGCACILVLWVQDGRVECTTRGMAAVAGPGDVVLASTGTSSVLVRSSGASLRSAVLDRQLVDRVASDQGLVWQPARFTGIVPLSSESARVWTDAHRFVANTVLPDENSGPLVVSAAGRLLAAAVLSSFPTEGARSPGAPLSTNHPPVLRRALAYIEEHASREIAVLHIARAVYVTPRALQYAFRKYLGTTPMAHLRRVRLDRAHHELVRNDHTTTTVAATAARWGFAHTGRFAALYRESYGRSPHVTLRE